MWYRENPLGNRKAVGRGGRDKVVRKDGSNGDNEGRLGGDWGSLAVKKVENKVCF